MNEKTALAEAGVVLRSFFKAVSAVFDRSEFENIFPLLCQKRLIDTGKIQIEANHLIAFAIYEQSIRGLNQEVDRVV